MRKQKTKDTVLLAIIILLSFGVCLTYSIKNRYVSAQDATVDELNLQKDEKRRVLIQIKERVADLQKQINDQRTKMASLKNEIQLFELQISQTQEQINAINAEIDVVNLDVIDTLNELETTKDDIATKLNLLENLIREIYKNDNKSPLEIVLTYENFSDILNQFQYTINFQNQNQELLNNLKQLQNNLEAKQALLNEKKEELSLLKTQSEATKASLTVQQNQRQNLLTTTRGQETKYKQMLAEVSEEEAKINREIFDLDLQIREKLGDKSLPAVSGLLAWPMDGILTQGYGETGFTKLGYTFHNGIDIAAPAGTRIYAVADGIVFATGTGKTAYGNWVVTKHSIQTGQGLKNIYALYAHLQKISTSPGQAVLQGDLIGLEGNTGTTTRLLYGEGRGYHIHFSIFDEEGFGIKDGAYPDIYGPYKIPYGYSYNPMDFLR